VTHGCTHSAQVRELSKYNETQVTLLSVTSSNFVSAPWSAASPVSVKFGSRHSLREGPAVIRLLVLAERDEAVGFVVRGLELGTSTNTTAQTAQTATAMMNKTTLSAADFLFFTNRRLIKDNIAEVVYGEILQPRTAHLHNLDDGVFYP